MITTTQYRELDKLITAHLKNLGKLHIADVRGNHTEELVKATEVSWRDILVYLLELTSPDKKYRLTPEQHAIVLAMIQSVTTTAAITETIRERLIIGEEEEIGKFLLGAVQTRLEEAKRNRNAAYEAFSKYMVNLLDFSAEE